METLRRNDPVRVGAGVRRRKELASLILMKRIHPKEFQAIHVKEGEPVVHPSSSEIGFYSAVLYNAQTMEMIRREDVGILVRTKDASSFEGGVSAGFAVLNSPIIVWCVCCSQSQISRLSPLLHFISVSMSEKPLRDVTADELKYARICERMKRAGDSQTTLPDSSASPWSGCSSS